ncbi:DapH/DapD/GlmU-related protein [Pseudanabaena sp. lw0831]|uniref:acyltransferase n=1 Tax=Pseudanabaena sp. lw0831 TaxID=1357935 RepID=UPI00191672E6|nr:acyltransferase [Pseudanabaena sp. lw0831]
MLLKNIKHQFRLWLNNFKVAYRYDVLMEKAVTLKYIDTISFGHKCTLQSGVYIYGSRRGMKVILGDDVAIGMGSTILGEGGVEIGDATHFGPNVVLTTQYGNRSTSSLAETSLKYQPVKIGKGVWIGAGSIIMPGTELGDYCSVAPNSVVYGRWIDSNIQLMGNPARKRKF